MKKRTVTLVVMIVMIILSTFGFSVVNAASYDFEDDANSCFDYNNDGCINTMDLARLKHEFISGNTDITQNDIVELKEFLFGNGSPKLIEPPVFNESISYSCSCYDLTKYGPEEAAEVMLNFTNTVKTGSYDISINEIKDDTVTIMAKSNTDYKYLIVRKISEHTTENLVFYYNNDFILLYSPEYGVVALLK